MCKVTKVEYGVKNQNKNRPNWPNWRNRHNAKSPFAMCHGGLVVTLLLVEPRVLGGVWERPERRRKAVDTGKRKGAKMVGQVSAQVPGRARRRARA